MGASFFEAPFYGAIMKKVVSVIVCFILMIAIGAGAVVAYLSVSEFSPGEVEPVEISGDGTGEAPVGDTIRLMTWNLGYGALGDNADFFMDGGKMVNTADRDRVIANLNDISSVIQKTDPDILLTQEIDRDSARSYFIDEAKYLSENSSAEVFDGVNAFAVNFKVSFVPLPVPPIGKVYGGIATYGKYDIGGARRIALPCPFKWPLRTFNLKRCLLETRIPVEGSDKELVIFNLHLEAYDSGEGKVAQTRLLKDVLRAEFDAGNYVIAGGDFNQVFSNVDISAYPVLEGMWKAGSIDVSEFDDDYIFVADSGAPSCRSLDRPLAGAGSRDPEDFQYYVIDGYIVSPNIEIESFHTEDLGFVSSDHNPVIIDFKLN